jgi:hypothetical protein
MHEGFLLYARFRWLKIASVICVAAIVIYCGLLVLTDFRLKHAGGTWYGYTLGTIGALLIVWLTLLGVRKRAMTPGHWSLKKWVSAHVYLGLSLIVIATLHSGFQFGWNIHTLAYALMMLVIISGIFGIVAYAYLPLRLSENRGEVTQKQMVEIIRSLDRRLHDAAQPLSQEQAALVQSSIENTPIGGTLAKMRAKASGNEAVALDHIASLLESKNETLVKARRHIQIRSMLEVWLYVHVPATFALLAALTAHIVSVFFYW